MRPVTLFGTVMAATTTHCLALQVEGMYRYAVKGLSPDHLDFVSLEGPSSTFPNDRRFALLKEDIQFKDEWLHKECFLCAFTHPTLLAGLKSSYSDESDELTICDRQSSELLFHANLNKEPGRGQLGHFLSNLSGESVKCVYSPNKDFQFGNTSSGWKQRADTRTLHIVNRQTVKVVAEKIGVPLSPLRFRPNLVIDAEPWVEFDDWVPQNRKLVSSRDGLALRVIAKTVRCDGVSVDPDHPSTLLDVPDLLSKSFRYGPYLGVYAVTESPGDIRLGDVFKAV